MKRFLITISAATALVALAPLAAEAAPWRTINQRQAKLDQRIDQGVHSGELTRVEATRLRSEFRTISHLEARYRRSGGGLSYSERRDLDRRFDTLSRRVRGQKHDRQKR